ncbi:MAG: NADH-quinone oxidoreductase subunit N [Proteobacteria bacterium]|nr:NADH-quinone oxidoreductase subunit N [Pseudomonadota bacterium]
MTGGVGMGELQALAPLLVVTGWAALLLLVSALAGGRSLRLGPLALCGLLLALAAVVWDWRLVGAGGQVLFGGLAVSDRFALFLDALLLLAGSLTVLISGAYLDEHGFADDAYFSLLLLAISGMMLLVHATSLVMLLIGLETMSLAIYALVAFWVGKATSAEAALKYFVMGAVASAFLVFGVALIYGVTGATGYRALAEAAAQAAGQPLLLLGMVFVLGALAFKVAIVPLHMWVPDAYEGAPTPVTGLMASAVKAAGFGALLRLLATSFAADGLVYGSTGWLNPCWTLAALTMSLGNLAALRQPSIKRMLAYSSVAHAGYVLLGVIAAGLHPGQLAPVLFYLLSYAAATLGALGVVAWIGRREAERLTFEDWAGLARHHPVVALAMTVFMLSLAGVPPTGGFFAKFYLFRAALRDPQLVTLVVIAVLNSVVSVYYYLRPVVAMYFQDGVAQPQPLARPGVYAMLGLALALVLLLGLLPGVPLDWALHAQLAR